MASGFEVRRVPHPTANYPWYGLQPGDDVSTGPDHLVRQFGIGRGMAFRHAETAMSAVERLLAEGWKPGAVITWEEPHPHPRGSV